MREQEVRELYEAYRQVHQSQEEVEQLDEEAPERITKPSRNKRLMKDAGPARVHNPKKVEEEVEQFIEDKKYDRNRQRAAQRAAARNEARKQGKTGSVPGVGYVSPRAERETYRDSAGVERHKSGAKMPQKEETDLFDYILEHLIAEGYADTNESALAIMANMSEEWRHSIVEEVLDEELTGARKQTASDMLDRKLRDVETLRKLSARKRQKPEDVGSGNRAKRRAGKEVKDSRIAVSDS